jgi:hypothetical protein
MCFVLSCSWLLLDLLSALPPPPLLLMLLLLLLLLLLLHACVPLLWASGSKSASFCCSSIHAQPAIDSSRGTPVN